ncbi:MAG: helix-turn-helix transcriptional regulator [Microthrixaceae bacterium]|nr:helix-turn-helix transcriptional regulator [Microthrixaceae bacterium]
MRETLGDVLRAERVDQERTLVDVAGDAAVSLAYLSEVERGRKDVSADVLTAIGGALGLEVPVILERTARRLRVQGGVRASVQLLAA